LRYNALNKVQWMPEDAQPNKVPLIFFRTLSGSEPVREWLKELPVEERQAIGRDLLRAQWQMARGNAAVPRDGRRPLGNSDGPAHETHGTRVALPLP
jgi:hypothetical protein